MKVAFVTGANKGVGYAIVEKLATFLSPTDWDVYLTARNEKLGEASLLELQKKGLSLKFHQLDVTDSFSRRRFLDFLKSKYPDGINIAINNAGIAYKNASTAPFSEQASVTIATNFIDTIDFTEEFIPLLAENARVVNVSSGVSILTLKKLNEELYSKFTSSMTLQELRTLVTEFVSLANSGTHEQHGWPTTAYGVSKLALTKASYILGDQLKNDPRNIVINSCCPGYVDTDMTSHKGTKTIEQGADTPFYLATLPIGVTEPLNEFVSDRTIRKWSKETDIHF